MTSVQTRFEAELRRRRLPFQREPASGRYQIKIAGTSLLVTLDNLQRDVSRDGDNGRIERFVDAIILSASGQAGANAPLANDRLYWCLEPNDYEEPADFRVPLSDRVDRVLIHLSGDNRLITWVTPEMLRRLNLSEIDASTAAFRNLNRALAGAKLQHTDIDGVRLGFFETHLPFKAALMLAPGLKHAVAGSLGWPLMSVAPDRDFLYLWDARHTDFASRVGGVVIHEYTKAAYPVSTEVFEISDRQIRAIGAFSA